MNMLWKWCGNTACYMMVWGKLPMQKKSRMQMDEGSRLGSNVVLLEVQQVVFAEVALVVAGGLGDGRSQV